MEFKGNTAQSNTNHTNRAVQPQPRPGEGNSFMVHDGGSKKTIIGVVIAVAVVLLAGLSWWYWNNNMADGINKSEYQAIFLTNGQVYFGKLSNVNDKYINLGDIYYLQVQQSVQPSDNKNNNNENPQVSLAKLGNELHGPEDTMKINRDQVLFWENLKDSGKVVQAIKQNQQQQK